MDGGRILVAMRLARPARKRGFCPACGVGLSGRTEVAVDGVTVAIVLAVAAVAWAFTTWQMVGAGMTTGLGGVSSFATTWTVMMAAMMLPSAIPLVYRFAGLAEGRRGRPVALAVLGLVYMGIWLVFGVACYLVYEAPGCLGTTSPWPEASRWGWLRFTR